MAFQFKARFAVVTLERPVVGMRPHVHDKLRGKFELLTARLTLKHLVSVGEPMVLGASE